MEKLFTLKLKVMLIIGVLSLYCDVPKIHGTLTPTWKACNCRWDDWKEWSDCTSTCFGIRVRSRSVWTTCDEFNDCASDDEGSNIDTCNGVCFNGGTPTGIDFLPCTCVVGYKGSCCSERVFCGGLNNIPHGMVTVTSEYYNGKATYSCESHYNITVGDVSRLCQVNGAWSGSQPQCVYANHCSSLPCVNYATCVDLLGDFQCVCGNGWAGRYCEIDQNPPTVKGCSKDIHVNATSRTVHLTWSLPVFTDPVGKSVEIVSNYPSPNFTFPWGDHTIQYVATKPSNGLSAECIFQIFVRPTPCSELNSPANGALVCNGWKKDYGRYCMVTCQQNFTLSPIYSFLSWYVCGASGNWIPASPVPDCEVQAGSVAEAELYHPNYSQYSYLSSCDSESSRKELQSLYINKLYKESGFEKFCTSFLQECTETNVEIRC